MLDDHHRVARVDQSSQDLEQSLHIGGVQAHRRFIQNVQSTPGGAPRELSSQLDPLSLTPGKRRGRLAQANVAQPHVVQGLQLASDRRDILKEAQGLIDGHVKDIGDAGPLVANFEGLAIVALTVADFTRHIDIGQELHLDLNDARALTGFAASPLDVEREATGLVAPHFGL